MNEQQAREILKERIRPDGRLVDNPDYIRWWPGDNRVQLDGIFMPSELEAIAWWIRNTKPASTAPRT